MTAYLYPQENALDFGFEVFAEGRRDETEQAKPENEKEECAAGRGTVHLECLGVKRVKQECVCSPLLLCFSTFSWGRGN